ncbi:MAG TPA: hypothetical protein VF597_00680 [Candidatus Saccharimonadales bacterium]
MSSNVVARLAELNNSGQWKQADQLAAHYAQNASFQPDAGFFFQWALARRLIGKNPQEQIEAARLAPGYSEQMAGDFDRDAGLDFLRQGVLDKAEQMFDSARSIHDGALNRMAVLEMCYGRLFLTKAQYVKAEQSHEKANQIWCEIADADPQWIKNNRFHWLKAKAALGKRERSLYLAIKDSEPRLDRKVCAFLMHYFGKVGFWLTSQAESKLFK